MTARLQFESLFGVRAQCPGRWLTSCTRLPQPAAALPTHDLYSRLTANPTKAK